MKMTVPNFNDHAEPKPKKPFTLYLSTPLYLSTTIISLASHLLLIFSSDGYDNSQDDIFLFPLIALFSSLMTGPIRCFFWVVSFCVRVRFVSDAEEEYGISLGDDGQEERRRGKGSGWTLIGKILGSWNAWVAATLMASVGVRLWRLIVNAKGRDLAPQAGWGAAVLGVAW